MSNTEYNSQKSTNSNLLDSEQKAQCIICAEQFAGGDDGARRVCRNSHGWCRRCAVASVEAAARNITDAACMPPRCCGDVLLPTGEEDSAAAATATEEEEEEERYPVLRLLDPEARAV
ncbi:hypothetical protein VTH82DRAFT_3074 [Thermothelomyces myriococcoides]